MKWRARTAYLVMFLALTSVGLVSVVVGKQSHLRIVAGAMWFTALALFAALISSMFLLFRCPHCHARQIRNTYDWFFVGSHCWSCNELLDGPETIETDEGLSSRIEDLTSWVAEVGRAAPELQDLARRDLQRAQDKLARLRSRQLPHG